MIVRAWEIAFACSYRLHLAMPCCLLARPRSLWSWTDPCTPRLTASCRRLKHRGGALPWFSRRQNHPRARCTSRAKNTARRCVTCCTVGTGGCRGTYWVSCFALSCSSLRVLVVCYVLLRMVVIVLPCRGGLG